MHVMMRESWTDERLDEFGKRMDERFDRVDERFTRVDERFATARAERKREFEQVGARLDRVESKMEQIDSRLYSMSRTMVIAAIAMSSSMIGGFGVLVAVLAAKL
jgi:RNase H-fold protein (predicted Holliday junction resolvase)